MASANNIPETGSFFPDIHRPSHTTPSVRVIRNPSLGPSFLSNHSNAKVLNIPPPRLNQKPLVTAVFPGRTSPQSPLDTRIEQARDSLNLGQIKAYVPHKPPSSRSAPSSPPFSPEEAKTNHAQTPPSQMRRLQSDPQPSSFQSGYPANHHPSNPSSRANRAVYTTSLTPPRLPISGGPLQLHPLPPAHPFAQTLSFPPVSYYVIPRHIPPKSPQINLDDLVNNLATIASEDEDRLNAISHKKLLPSYRLVGEDRRGPFALPQVAATTMKPSVELSSEILEKEEQAKELLKARKEKGAYDLYYETTLLGSVDAYQALAKKCFQDVQLLAEQLPTAHDEEMQNKIGNLLVKRLHQGLLFYQEPARCGNRSLVEYSLQDIAEIEKILPKGKLTERAYQLLESFKKCNQSNQ